MVKIVQISHCQEFQKVGDIKWLCAIPCKCFFYQLRFKNEIWQCEKHKLFITVFTTIHWLKPAGPAEPILLTSTSLMGALPDDTGKAG